MGYHSKHPPRLTPLEREQLHAAMRSLGLVPEIPIPRASHRMAPSWRRRLPSKLPRDERRMLRKFAHKLQRS